MLKTGNINDIFDVLSGDKPQHIVILPHVRTDPDALGSSFAMAQYLLQLGYHPRIIVDERPSQNSAFIFQDFRIEVYNDILCQEMEEPDLFIFLDHHDIDRLAQRKTLVEKFQETNILIIDHHLIEDNFSSEIMGKIDNNKRQVTAWIESDRSSASELVAELFLEDHNLNKNIKLDLNIASALLAGIYGDTGGLRFSNTSKRTYEVCAFLKLEEIQIDKISDNLFGEKKLNQLQMVGAIFNNSHLNEKGNLIWYTVTPEFLAAYQCDQEDLEGVCSAMRDVENVDLAILIRQISDKDIRVNLRSNENINSADLASYFEGGGHARAAGITYKNKKSLKEFSTELIAKAEFMLNG